MDKVAEKKAEFGQNTEHQDFFQSQEWRNFQEAFGRKTHIVKQDNFCAYIIEHKLSIVGKYFYVPRGPLVCHPERSDDALASSEVEGSRFLGGDSSTSPITASLGMTELLRLAKEKNAGWIRVEPRDGKMLDMLIDSIEIDGNKLKLVKAPYDVQPKEVFVVDISKPEEQLLAEMKSKTRYNIGVARKRDVSLRITNTYESTNSQDIKEFLKLTKEMARRQGIVPHPDAYYEKMFETFPEDMLKLYIAEYNGNIIAANLMLFYGNTATYLHGASSDADRNVMAPFLLHWQAILDAKEKRCKFYDFGGVKTLNSEQGKINNKNQWEGITKFKMGFSITAEPVVFPGTYDIIVNPRQYALYKGLQKAKMMLCKIRR